MTVFSNSDQSQKYRGMSPIQIALIQEIESLEKTVIQLAKLKQKELFPEELDYMYDTSSEADLRKEGTNPRPIEYQQEVNARRESLGVSPLDNSGMASNKDSWKHSIRAAIDEMNFIEKVTILNKEISDLDQ